MTSSAATVIQFEKYLLTSYIPCIILISLIDIISNSSKHINPNPKFQSLNVGYLQGWIS